ncbi:MAG: hypothetical protein WBL11_07200 [Bacteroidales bacterium]|jgi:hypothetical protein|nr:hypothetical protein [Bacteroidales bacterium]MDI9575120.1 hypothetical protein [Bacteroidota bacterium]MDD2593214.1 hypothetical protein [Bacteroidales bacterium]MDD3755203.1 hypothetical protein [Bacteroidales bacterium]MDY0400330.1 hypothetical protein [Bacteroidales bacterium]
MKNNFKQTFINLLSLFMAVFMILLIVNNIVFLHVHKLPNGEIIVHAHPYNKSNDTEPIKNHTHSNREYLVLDQLKNIFVITFIFFSFLFFSNKILIFKNKIVYHGFDHDKFYKNKAPPYFILNY